MDNVSDFDTKEKEEQQVNRCSQLYSAKFLPPIFTFVVEQWHSIYFVLSCKQINKYSRIHTCGAFLLKISGTATDWVKNWFINSRKHSMLLISSMKTPVLNVKEPLQLNWKWQYRRVTHRRAQTSPCPYVPKATVTFEALKYIYFSRINGYFPAWQLWL